MLETRTSLRAGVATGSYQIGKSHVITAITALAHRDIEVALILQQLPEVADVPPGEAVGVKAQVRLVRTGEAPHRMLASMALLAPSTWLTLATFVRYSTENVWRWAGMQRERLGRASSRISSRMKVFFERFARSSSVLADACQMSDALCIARKIITMSLWRQM